MPQEKLEGQGKFPSLTKLADLKLDHDWDFSDAEE